MKKIKSTFLLSAFLFSAHAQQNMTTEVLLDLGRISPQGMSKDGKSVVFSVGKKHYVIPVDGDKATEIKNVEDAMANKHISPNGKYSLSVKDTKINNVFGKDWYPKLDKSDVMIYDDLNYRHWDTWEDGSFSHLFIDTKEGSAVVKSVDLMPNEPYDCPQKPLGGAEDYLWSPDSKHVIYVTKKKAGKEYAMSTNTDIYSYELESGKTTNLTIGMNGYDMQPAYSSTGVLAWASMKTDGYESDKTDIVIDNGSTKLNLTQHWDESVDKFQWSLDGKTIFFTAPIDGTVQLFEVNNPGTTKSLPVIKQITKGDFNVNDIVGQVGTTLVVTRSDMNHANELYTIDLNNGKMKQLSHVNDGVYKTITPSKTERRYVTTTDGKKMLVWIIYPPNFDPTKKYPTLLYCQGGPQSALTQGYSFRWNFQLMAANGYIVVAPNRRGMPGHGIKWNEQISKDYGGQVMQDYLSAIDTFSRQAFVDKNRLGCVGASFGGYSTFYLAGIHQGRFKTFISHDGIFDWTSMYGTTEELWFVNWDLGGPYWEKDKAQTQKSYNEFNPVNMVAKWNTPILIIQGGKDYRVPIEQGLSAFQAAQLKGIKSRLLYFPNENHFVLDPQNANVWQNEFYRWLKETL